MINYTGGMLCMYTYTDGLQLTYHESVPLIPLPPQLSHFSPQSPPSIPLKIIYFLTLSHLFNDNHCCFMTGPAHIHFRNQCLTGCRHQDHHLHPPAQLQS